MDKCIQEAMLRCMQVPSISAVGPIVTEKRSKQKILRNLLDCEIYVTSYPVHSLT